MPSHAMSAPKFLEQVADYYINSPAYTDFADLIFILPNKRSAMFLKRYFQLRTPGAAMFMPRFSTFGKFIARRALHKEPSRNESLFILYEAYKTVLRRHGVEEDVKNFDRFVFWGEMILSDFDQIDSALASPAELYKNLRNMREITADFLSVDQKKIINEIWGETSLTQHIDRFWFHTRNNDDDNKQLVDKFISLWRIMDELYVEFTESLLSKGMATAGMQARICLDKLKEESVGSLRANNFVFVGHADLTTAEIAIIDRLSSAGAAQFFWDLSAANLNVKGPNDTRTLAGIVRLAKKYRMPDDFSLVEPEGQPDIEVIGISSSVGQAKEAAEIIKGWADDGLITEGNSIETAVVLPDQSLLMPLMLAMPESIDKLNITMTMQVMSTAFATLLRVIIALHLRCRRRHDGTTTYFFKDVVEILVHPHLQKLAPEQSKAIRDNIRRKRLYNLDAHSLADAYPTLAYIFKPIENRESVDEVYQYIAGLIDGLRLSLERYEQSKDVAARFEADVLRSFGDKIAELYRLIKDYKIEMNESTFFMFIERLLSGDSIALNGTPLEGLQVMGVLETRALDFDNIIVLSMNERTFPRRDYIKTMIPNNLRRGYGLDPIEQTEGYYAYYFFRMISRARNVRLLYDSRQGNRGAGEISRYITQLMYLHDNGNIRHKSIDLGSMQSSVRKISVVKDSRVMDDLNEFKIAGHRNISASSLKSYLNCPLSFYLQYVKGLYDEDEPQGYVNQAQQGDIFHHSMLRVYEPYAGQQITTGVIDKMLADDSIARIVLEELCAVAYNMSAPIPLSSLNAEARLIFNVVERQVRQVLEVERQAVIDNGPFTHVAGELTIDTPQWQVTPDHTINFKMQIDRVDRLADGTYRFIDYKTGVDSLAIGSKIGNLFNGDHSRQGVLQLMIYAEAFRDINQVDDPIEISLFKIREIMADGVINPITYKNKPLDRFPAWSSEFRPMLNDLISSIFDQSVPFGQTDNNDHCRYCPFVDMCGRIVEERRF